MRYFLFVSALLLASCNPKIYQNSKDVTAEKKATYPKEAAAYQPIFEKQLYNCLVDGKMPLGKAFHLSGILFLKKMEDGGTRVVFQNQMGMTYFDFGWSAAGEFTAHSVIAQMDKPALIKTLRKDFELLLFKNLSGHTGVYQFENDATRDFVRFDLARGFVYYVFEAGKLARIENADARKKVVVMTLQPPAPKNNLPEALTIQHLSANFTIQLNTLSEINTEENVAE